MTRPLDRRKTLDELEPPPWGKPEYDSSLVTRCHELRRKSIGDFSVEDLSVMIGQRIGLPWLVPLALEVLERDPLTEGDFYPGDLLVNVLRVPAEYWAREWEWRDRLKALLGSLTDRPKELDDAVEAFLAHTV